MFILSDQQSIKNGLYLLNGYRINYIFYMKKLIFVRYFFVKSVYVHSFRLMEWSDDESIAARLANNEVHFFENNNFGKSLSPFTHSVLSSIAYLQFCI